MRILMLSWEYPPRVVGGLAPHVHGLSGALTQQGHEVHVITQGGDGLPATERDRGVTVHRIHPYSLWSLDFAGDIHHLNFAFLEKALAVAGEYGDFDVVHAHDWLVAYAGRALKHGWQKPLIATIHATEWGRHNGLHNDLQRYISQVEWWLGYEAWRVIVCSQHMERELGRIFQMPGDKIAVIPNGVHPDEFTAAKAQGFRRSDYAADHERILFYVGRLVWEKGVQVLVEAMPQILRRHPAKLVIGGTGTQMNYLKHLANRNGVGDKVHFAGYVHGATKVGLLRAADVAVFPSLYEPFGIVALEGMAAETPVVVSDTGGLAEIVRHRQNGLKALTGNVNSLAEQIITALDDELLVKAMTKQAAREVREVYSWSAIAAQTLQVYKTVKTEANLAERRGPVSLFRFKGFSQLLQTGSRH
ncbi:glycosyltransferase [Heliobacterium gestii]|uniref:Glycosyltransferase n=1 Tax=Heliomicrobium gestii TaxID=2699 RepID=A0A845LB41_HELGE|nr:glycosyltransferase family 4 protein [Heliomicrobium gestii]MBM7867603.1 glycogen(starch) synthase [Heliomicrobium gestii]MZP43997.1 glycosyltransferase [Heliomicrobium gestii]